MQPLQDTIAAYAPIRKRQRRQRCVKTFYLLLKTSCATPIECATRDPAKASHFHSRGFVATEGRQRLDDVLGTGLRLFLARDFATEAQTSLAARDGSEDSDN